MRGEDAEAVAGVTASTSDIRVSRFERLVTPREVLAETPASAGALDTVTSGRRLIRAALGGTDKRQVVICGPCSIHDPASALDYARRLAELAERVRDRYIVIMRAYFEKPRTTIGWKGLIYDPARDDSHDMNRGLREARRLLLAINELGLPCATEFLDPIVPQYTADLVAWAAIGARTTESQTHRQMASGLSMPVGFKNATDGGIQSALDAMLAATHAQSFLGIDPSGTTSIVRTTGNPDVHIILRGGTSGPNHDPATVETVVGALDHYPVGSRPVMIDCSHGNSNKDYRRQSAVFRDVCTAIASGQRGVLGLMLESNLVEGRQAMGPDLVYGQSITDGCIGWEETEALLSAG